MSRRRARTRRGAGRLDSWQLYSLTVGDALDHINEPWGQHEPAEVRLEAWKLHGEAITAWWIKPSDGTWPPWSLGDPEHEPAGQPFYRPNAWWEFDAPEPPRCLACGETTMGGNPWLPDYVGQEQPPVLGNDWPPVGCPCGLDRVAESVASYLVRHRLVLPGELVTARVLEPEFIKQVPARGPDGALELVERTWRGGKLIEVSRHPCGLGEHLEAQRAAFAFFDWQGDGVRPRRAVAAQPSHPPLDARAVHNERSHDA